MERNYAYIHKGEGNCGYPGFYLHRRPTERESILTMTMLSTAGIAIRLDIHSRCGTCGKSIADDQGFLDYSFIERMQ